MRSKIEESYFNWLCEFVRDEEPFQKLSYNKLFELLYGRYFRYILPMDENRMTDGIDLRYRFGREKGLDDRIIASEIDYRPCGILEMMVALSLRIEEQLMIDTDVGDRTGQWFWEMVVSLGLGKMNDRDYDDDIANDSIDRFLAGEYARNGEGGLFTLSDDIDDIRKMDIWSQAMWHLDEVIY